MPKTVLSSLPSATSPAERPWWPSILRGWACKCPACGRGAIFGKYLKVNDHCAACNEALYHHRADDAPPYFTMTIVGHVVVAGILIVERRFQPEVWVHLLLWLPLTVGLSLWLLPRIKGALIALQWAARMHGFALKGAAPDPAEPAAWDHKAPGAPRAP